MSILIFVLLCVVAATAPIHAQEYSAIKLAKGLIVRHIPNPTYVYSSPESEPKSELYPRRDSAEVRTKAKKIVAVKRVKGEAMYRWRYRTEVKNSLDVPLQITNFEFYFYEQGKWTPRNIKGRTLTSADFTQWYAEGASVIDGWIPPGKIAVEAENWVSYADPFPPRSKWTYTAKDSAGNMYYAEAEIELIPFVSEQIAREEIDRSRSVQISGRVIGADNQPPSHAQARLTNFHGYYFRPMQIVVAQTDGRFSIYAVKPGLYRLVILAVDHALLSVPLILDEKDQEIKIDIRPAPYDYHEPSGDKVLPSINFGEQNTRLQKVLDIDRMVQKQEEAYRLAATNYREAHDDMREFQFDWSETVAILKRYMQDESDLLIQQFAAIELGQLPASYKNIDSEICLKIFKLLPPNSIFWSAVPHLPGNLAHIYGRAMEEKLLKAFVDKSPDRAICGRLLANLAMRAHQEGDKETAAQYYKTLKADYGDLEEIQHQLMMLNPDKRIMAGKPVTDFEIKLMDKDGTISNKSLLGRFYLLDFWAVWCGPCVEEMKELHAVYEKFKNKNFTILSLSFDQNPDNVVKFRKEQWAMPWLHTFIEGGFNSDLAKTFEVTAIPKPILVGSDGLILEEGVALRGEALGRTLSKYLEHQNIITEEKKPEQVISVKKTKF